MNYASSYIDLDMLSIDFSYNTLQNDVSLSGLKQSRIDHLLLQLQIRWRDLPCRPLLSEDVPT